MSYSRKNPSQTGDSVGGYMGFPGVFKNVEIPTAVIAGNDTF